ncbi:MAG: amidohydrolase [Acidobacteriota bacterium]
MLQRRHFLKKLGVVALFGSRRLEPDLVLHGAKILTMDPRNPTAEAVAISQGRFLAVGSDVEVLSLATSHTRKIKLGGKTLVPGFIDAHCHPAESGRLHLRQVDCDLRSISQIQQAIRARADSTPDGQWVLGFKYDDTKIQEGRLLNRSDLDQAAPAHPVFISHRGGHTAFVNSLALRQAGVSETSPDPPGGHFGREAGGRLNGNIREKAVELFTRLLPANDSRSDFQEGVRLISERMARAGITSVHDADATPEDLRAYQDALAAGQLSFRVYCLMRANSFDRMLAAGVQTGLGDEWVRVGGLKLYCDGSISERTARLAQPYVGRADDYGILVTDEEQLYGQAKKAHQAHWQLGIHANGDAAIDLTLRVYERLQRELPHNDPRFRLEHCTVITPELVKRIKNLGAIPNPFSTYVYYHGEKMHEYGANRLNRMFAVRSFLDAGVKVTMTSDYSAGPYEPMMALQSMVSRTDASGRIWGPDQRVGVEEALRVGTIHGAYASFEERLKGSIEPGKLADLVVLGRNPLSEPSQSLINIPVEGTMVGGRWTHQAQA